MPGMPPPRSTNGNCTFTNNFANFGMDIYYVTTATVFNPTTHYTYKSEFKHFDQYLDLRSNDPGVMEKVIKDRILETQYSKTMKIEESQYASGKMIIFVQCLGTFHWQIQVTPPQRDPILSILHTFLLKSGRIRDWRPSPREAECVKFMFRAGQNTANNVLA